MANGIEAPMQVVCVEVRRRLPGGVTEPQLVVVEDADANRHQMVLKMRLPGPPGGHYEGTSLACELISAMLGRWLSLRVPDYAIITIPEVLPGALHDPRLRELFRRNIGENFGTVFEPGCVTWSPGLAAGTPVCCELARILAFDATVINGDRKWRQPNLLARGDELIMIDHSLAIPVHQWNDTVIAESPLLPAVEIREHCSYETLIQNDKVSLRGSLADWARRVNDKILEEVRRHIPATWEQQSGHLEKIFTFLAGRDQRRTDIEKSLCQEIR